VKIKEIKIYVALEIRKVIPKPHDNGTCKTLRDVLAFFKEMK
jgi:hypothetical protein